MQQPTVGTRRVNATETPGQARARMQEAREASGAAKAGGKSKKGRFLTHLKALAPSNRGHVDIPMLTLVLILLLFGLVMLFSASYPSGNLRHNGDSYAFIRPQVQYAVLGLAAMIGASLVDYRILRKFAWPLMVLSLVLLVLVLFMDEKNGAKRWIWLNGAHTQAVQPSEIAKFAVILLFAALVAANQKKIKSFLYGFFPFITILGLVAVLLICEPHLSCTILILGIGIIMMFAGGTSIKWFVLAGGLAVAALYFALTTFPDLVPYASERINTWLDPFNANEEDAHQIIQSLIAVGSGGPWGQGIGHSVQKFLYLPEMYNDYIFAVLCEELGFVGAIATIVLFLLLFLRGLYLTIKVKDKFGSMLILGISVQIALQAFLHIAVNTNAIPSTGISMPFFSSGGSSLTMLLGQVGIMLSVSRQAHRPAQEESLPDRQEQAGAEGERPSPDGGREGVQVG